MSYLIYEGPSAIDGKPIFAALTGIENPSSNRKTGAMAQLFILADGVNPVEAYKTGQDKSVCGDCPLRGNDGKERSCYVNLGQAPNAVYRHKANLKVMPKHVLNNRALRLGAYGDPAALPIDTVKKLVKKSIMTTGYTHQWRTCDPEFKNYLMASCDNEADYHAAQADGWATFRVKRPDQLMFKSETLCPASEEAGHQMTCITCGKCKGGEAHNVVINVHGTGKKWFQ